jgi:hypothetical protein
MMGVAYRTHWRELDLRGDLLGDLWGDLLGRTDGGDDD